MKPLYVARVKRLWFLPSRYKDRTHTVVEGVAASGEVSRQGVVATTEDWDGRKSVVAGPATVHSRYEHSTGEVRPLTMDELIDRGLFVVGSGPTGIRRQEAGIRALQS